MIKKLGPQIWYLCMLGMATVSAGCAVNKSASHCFEVPTADLFVEVEEVKKKMDAKQDPSFKETGDPEVDLIVKPYIDAASENAREALELIAACNKWQIIHLVNKSADAKLEKHRNSNLTREDRSEATIAVLSALSSDQRTQWDHWVDTCRGKLEAEAATSLGLREKGKAALELLHSRVAVGGRGRVLPSAGPTNRPIGDGIAQVEAVQEFTEPIYELIERYLAYLDANDKMIEGSAAGRK